MVLQKSFNEKYKESDRPNKLHEIQEIINDCTSDLHEQAFLYKYATQLITNEAGIDLPDPERVIVVIHGIRTRGLWQNVISEELKTHGHNVIPLGYDYFDVVRFITPFFFRGQKVREIRDELLKIKKELPDKELVIIAHSFGTYIISKIIKSRPDIKLSKLILCGSIIPRKFEWNELSTLSIGDVINECGLRDCWPVLAKVSTWGYGNTGTFGFKRAVVRDRIHNATHSDYLELSFIKKFWLPYIDNGLIEQSIEPQIMEKLNYPFYISFLGLLPTAFIPLAGLGAIFYFF